jgi:hypothetical protein
MERHQKTLPAREPAQAGRSGPRCYPAAALRGSNVAGFVEKTRRFMLFRGERYPDEMGAVEGKAFLIPLAVKGNAPSPT